MTRKITVFGMTSETCRKTITTTLVKTAGIARALVNLPYNFVEVEYSEETITLGAIKEIIKELNYDPM